MSYPLRGPPESLQPTLRDRSRLALRRIPS